MTGMRVTALLKPSRWSPIWSELARCRKGHFAIVFALAAPAILTTLGWAVDYGIYSSLKSRAQAAADAAAVAGAKSLTMADASVENVGAVVESVVQSYISSGTGHDFAKALGVNSQVSSQPGEPMQVSVKVTGPVGSLFVQKLGFGDWKLAVNSVAVVVGTPNICVLALEKSALGAIWLEKSAHLTGQNCSVYSNSSSNYGVVVRDSATMKATTVCSAGGVEGRGQIDPDALVDCPHFEDPLAGRPEPTYGPCNFNDTAIESKTTTLQPGVYCGGLKISGSSRVSLSPGMYVVKDGPLLIKDTSEFVGEDVGFFLTGSLSLFYFDPDSKVSLSAQKSGPMAGLLFFGSRSRGKLLIDSILSSDARRMLGTIYLPTTSLIVDSSAQMGQESAYTAIVARRLVLLSGPQLILNTNYDQTDVPVPAGIRGAGQGVALVK